MSKHKIFIISILILVPTLSGQAQVFYESTEQTRIMAWLGLGYSRMDMSAKELKVGGLAGGSIGLGVGVSLNTRFRFNLGAEFTVLTSRHTMENFDDTRQLIDTDGMPVEMKYAFTDYRENVRSFYVQVPLMLEYHVKRFYAAVGPKVGIHLQSTVITRSTALTTGEYDNLIGTFENMPNHYYTTTDAESSNKAKLNLNVIAAAEVGYTVIKEKHVDKLRIALFCDYGFFNLKKGKLNVNPVDYGQNPLDITLGGRMTNKEVKRINSMLAGVKVTLLLHSHGIRNNGRCQSGLLQIFNLKNSRRNSKPTGGGLRSVW